MPNNDFIEKTCKFSEIKELLNYNDVQIDSPDGFVPVSEYVDKGEWDEYVVSDIRGNSINVNENHLFYTQRGWILTKDLVLGDSILKDDGKYHITKVSQSGKTIPIVDIVIDSENHQYYANGFCSHNTNVGKAQPHDTIIPTSTGFKKFGELKVGDRVYGRDGNLTSITGVYPQGIKSVYKVTFSDGRSAECCLEHLWNIIKKNNLYEETVELSDIIKLLNTPTYKNRIYVPLCEPIQYESVPKLINPYTMGIYIGDGTNRGGLRFGFSTADREIVERIESNLHDGYKINRSASSDIDYSIVHTNTARTEKTSYYCQALHEYGLYSHEKFIPSVYITQSSVSERIDLLRGLLDSAGYVGKNKTIEYATTSPNLADDVMELVRSLGGIAHITSKIPTYTHRGERKTGKLSYNIKIHLQSNMKNNLNLIERKQNRLNGASKPLKLRVDSVELIRDDECSCISVDAPDSLYITNDYIVTHNTLSMIHFASSYIQQSKNVLYITLEMAEEEIARRIDANLFDVKINDVERMDEKKFKQGIGKLKTKTNGKLIIKQYPTGSGHVGHFRQLLQELWLKKNFKPDIIMVDYIGICASSRIKLGNTNSYFYVKAVAEELRGLGIEFECPIWTAVQATRGGFGNTDMDITDTAESFGLPATADLLFGVIRTEELDALGQLLIKQMKNRYGNKNYFEKFVIGVDAETQRLHNVEDSAQDNIHGGDSSGDNDDKSDPRTPRKPTFNRKDRKSKFKDFD